MVTISAPRAEARMFLAVQKREPRRPRLLQVAAGEIVQDRDPDDMVEGVLFLGAPRALGR